MIRTSLTAGALACALAMSSPAVAGVNCLDYLAADREFQETRRAAEPIRHVVIRAHEVGDEAALEALAQADGGRWAPYIQATKIYLHHLDEEREANERASEMTKSARTPEAFAEIRAMRNRRQVDFIELDARVRVIWRGSWGYDEAADRLALAYINAYTSDGGEIGDHRLTDVFKVSAQQRQTFCLPVGDPEYYEPLEFLAKFPPRFETLNLRAEASQ